MLFFFVAIVLYSNGIQFNFFNSVRFQWIFVCYEKIVFEKGIRHFILLLLLWSYIPQWYHRSILFNLRNRKKIHCVFLSSKFLFSGKNLKIVTKGQIFLKAFNGWVRISFGVPLIGNIARLFYITEERVSILKVSHPVFSNLNDLFCHWRVLSSKTASMTKTYVFLFFYRQLSFVLTGGE